MILRLFFAAFVAGAIAGLGVTALQQVTTTPLILEAEIFETAGAAQAANAHPGSGPATAEHAGWMSKNGIERIAYTAVANIILGIGFALLLVGCFAVRGQPVTGQTGVLWGLAGFAVFTLGPGIGLPPELPGMAAGELPNRQTWWLLAAACTAGGLWLLVMRRPLVMKFAGVALLAAPSIIGAPHPDSPSDAVSPELASQFAATSIIVSAIFWAALGWLTGTFHLRFAKLGTRQPHAAPAV